MTALLCPRCDQALVDGRCPSDHGEWLEASTLPNVHMATTPSDAREPRLACPRCRQAMEARYWDTTPLDRCVHGVWLEGPARKHFSTQLAAAIDTEREIGRLELLLGDPAARREIAARFIALERRCERLERELSRIDQRLTKARLDRWDIP